MRRGLGAVPTGRSTSSTDTRKELSGAIGISTPAGRIQKDDNLALRTALLLAVNLLQMEDDLPAVDFCNAMLGYFAPLARHFDENDNEHPFCGGYKAVRAKDENENLKVLIPTEYIRYVGGSKLAEGPE